MQLGSFKVGDKSALFDIKNDVSKILIRQEFTAPKLGDLGSTAKAQAKMLIAYWASSIENGKVTIQRWTKSLGQKFIIQGARLYKFAEICANNEGFIQIDPTNPSDPNCTTYIARYTLELSLSGAIAVSGGDYIRVEFEGFSKYNDGLGGGAGSADSTIYLNTISFYSNLNEHCKYSSSVAKAGEVTAFQCESHNLIAVPWNLSKLVLYSTMGTDLQIDGTELENISADMSDGVYLVNGLLFTHIYMRTIPVQMCFKGTLTLPTEGEYFLISNKNYEGTETK